MRARTFNFIFTMSVLGAIALTVGSSALMRAAACMLCMLALALLSAVLALVSARARVRLTRDRVIRGESAAYHVTLSYSSPLPVGLMAISLYGAPGEDERVLTFDMLPYRPRAQAGERVFPHRGVYSMGAGRLHVSDVFGLFHLSKRISPKNAYITVLPRARALAAMEFQMGDTGPEVARRYPDDASSPSGVRDWRDGDLLKRVHWKLTMKTYEPTLRNLKPMVRTYDEAARPDTIILPDLTRVDAVTKRALSIEDAICDACLSIARAQLEGENPVKLLLESERPVEVEGRSMLDAEAFADALALARFDSPAPYEQALVEATRRLDRTGALILITARLTLRVADAAIRLRKMSGMCVAVVWITDTRRAEAQELISRLELADVIARRDNPFPAGDA